MQRVPAQQACPAVHFASRRSVVSVKLFAKPVKVVLSEAFRFVQRRVDELASDGVVVKLLDVVGNDPKCDMALIAPRSSLKVLEHHDLQCFAS